MYKDARGREESRPYALFRSGEVYNRPSTVIASRAAVFEVHALFPPREKRPSFAKRGKRTTSGSALAARCPKDTEPSSSTRFVDLSHYTHAYAAYRLAVSSIGRSVRSSLLRASFLSFTLDFDARKRAISRKSIARKRNRAYRGDISLGKKRAKISPIAREMCRRYRCRFSSRPV